jgi:hypothetical protein
MSLSLNYNFTLQRVDPDNGIRNQLDGDAVITIPDDIFGDSTYAFNDGDVDKSIPLVDGIIDILGILTDMEITVKLNDVLGTPMTIRAGGTFFLDGKNITALFVSNASGHVAHPRIIQSVRQPGHSS